MSVLLNLVLERFRLSRRLINKVVYARFVDTGISLLKISSILNVASVVPIRYAAYVTMTLLKRIDFKPNNYYN